MKSHVLSTATWALLIVPLAYAGFSCLSNPCYYGICVDDLNSSFTCYCIDGYTGIQCQTNWDECWSSPCLNGATCLDGVAGYNCSCPDGFMGDVCQENFNECASNPCFNNGTCVDGVNGYTCACQPGFSGVFCETDIAVCNATDEARCMNGGMCREGPGVSFSCLCNPGWSGTLCELPVDECASTPCQNGAICVDLHASYACACLFGYTGKNCESEMHQCDASPCDNGALCLVEAGARVCYCVPDFHGDRCQFQYDECQRGPMYPKSPPRCLNGGTCLDGVDQFTCSCPADLTGPLCECLIIGPGEFDCTYNRPTQPPFTLVTTEYSREIPSSTEIVTSHVTTTEAVDTSESMTLDSTIMEEVSTTQQTTEQDLTSDVSVTSHVVSTTEIVYTTTPADLQETTAISLEETSSSFVSGLTETTSVTEITSYSVSTEAEEEKSSMSATTTSQQEESSIAIDDTTSYEGTTPSLEETSQFSDIPMASSTAESSERSSQSSEANYTTQYTKDSHATSTDSISETTTEYYSTEGLDGRESNETVTLYSHPTTESEARVTIATTAAEASIGPDTGTPDIFTVPHEVTRYTTLTSELPGLTTSDAWPTTEFSTEGDEHLTTEMQDCSLIPCLNKGTCVYTKQGPKCMCKFGWEGALCDQHTGIRVAAFTGNSYISHRLNNASGSQIEMMVKTLAPTGLLFCANLGNDVYMCLFLIDGMLKFQFSCGFQTMLFSEVELRVNNGFELSIHAMLELNSPNGTLRTCSATVRINNTLEMSGEQVAVMPTLSRSPMWLHLGGIPPHNAANTEVPSISGFTGCMHALKIDNASRSIFSDAVDGSEVTECSSLACLSNPCFGSATCVENKDQWSCLCPSGYLGVTCEQSVCENNPCLFGATCVVFPGSGFICLCPLGKHGNICENDLEIGQPSYSSSVHGLASYSAYTLQGAIHNSMELKFRFVPTSLEQIALMVFVGQDGYHDSRSDHLSVSFIKGYIVLTWNLGSGPRRIFTPGPISQRSNRPHTVRLGRLGQNAWLLVDNLGNVSGRSPGRLSQLNTRSVIYLGGHDSVNFTNLPHDLPLHTGFSGCLFDVELKAGRVAVPLQRTAAAMGRSVGQCGTTECHEHACQHGGACLPHGATFSCLCSDGWFGPQCALRYNPCDSSRHNCSAGATCVPLVSSYECDCPLGKAGKYCERDEMLSDVSFTGHRSYLSLPPPELQHHQACIDLEIRPMSDRGLVVFASLGSGASFLSLSLQGGILELRVAPGKHRRRSEPLVVRSRQVLAIGEWHRVLAGRYGRKIFLRVDETSNTGSLLAGETLPMSWTPLFLGGVPDLSDLPGGAVSGLPVPFNGCIRRLSLNWHHVTLDSSHIVSARNVADCDGTACGGDVCSNGGSCWLDKGSAPHCACPHQYTGPRCEAQLSCTEINCQNKGRCVKGTGFSSRCHCPIGWGGAFCEEAVNVGSPHFGGDGYLVVEKPSANSKRQQMNMLSKVDINFLFLNFSTAEPDGMILWSGQHNEFIGIGIEQGLLKLVWAWQGSETNSVTVHTGQVDDGAWHGLTLSIGANNISLWLDNQEAHSQTNTGNTGRKPISTDGVFYLGGFPSEQSVEHETSGHFMSSFSGCIKELAWSEEIITDFSVFEGENIGSCDI